MIDQDVQREAAVALSLWLTVLVGAPLGMLAGSVVPRDMEGVLLLLMIISTQFLVDPAKALGKFMPFWSCREIGPYAIDMTGSEYLRRGVIHALTCAVILFAVTTVIAARRLRGHAVSASRA